MCSRITFIILAAGTVASAWPILVTRYGSKEESAGSPTGLVVGRQLSVGSEVIVGQDEYIMTNAHVVADAQRIRVSFMTRPGITTGLQTRDVIHEFKI